MRGRHRAGQSLVEFAVVALVLYMLLAAILTFGHMLYVAQGLQSAADLAAREISRTPLGATMTFEEAIQAPLVKQRAFDPDLLVFDLDTLEGQDFFTDVVGTWPLLNQQLATLMIVDRPDFDGDGKPDRRFIRYLGALLSDASTPSGYTVERAIAFANALPVKRLFPLVICFLPGLFVWTLGPAFVQLFKLTETFTRGPGL